MGQKPAKKQTPSSYVNNSKPTGLMLVIKKDHFIYLIWFWISIGDLFFSFLGIKILKFLFFYIIFGEKFGRFRLFYTLLFAGGSSEYSCVILIGWSSYVYDLQKDRRIGKEGLGED